MKYMTSMKCWLAGMLMMLGVAHADMGDTFRVSVSSDGALANGDSDYISLSANGRIIVFTSSADNLVPGDTNTVGDIFVHDQQGAKTSLVSVSSAGVQGNGFSIRPSMSQGGRYVVFESEATNLVDGDTNGVKDIFLRDRLNGTTTRVSVSTSGTQSNGSSRDAHISADGRYVVFVSDATNLVADDTNSVSDVFVRDLQSGTTMRVSVSTGGTQGNGISDMPAISGDGNVVAFSSWADNLVANDTNTTRDIFVRDLQSGQTSRVSLDASSGQGSGSSEFPALSADGQYVVFVSYANLVAEDTNSMPDVYLRDRNKNETVRISVDSAGNQGDAGSSDPKISSDGRYVVFTSLATNLVPGDTNNNPDVFVHDRQDGSTTRVSVSSTGVEADKGAASSAISADGRFVAFRSDASTLVSGGTGQWKDIYAHQFLPYMFKDVPVSYWAYDYIQTLGNSGLTRGCDNENYCPDDSITRGQMAVFLERGINGSDYVPPDATGAVFDDVDTSYWSAAWIEQLAADQITSGCDANNYCPDRFVSRAEMAVFLLRAKHGASYEPPPATGTRFSDVPANFWAASWIEQLAAEQISLGCGADVFCPNEALSRAQMAIFLVRTFDL